MLSRLIAFLTSRRWRPEVTIFPRHWPRLARPLHMLERPGPRPARCFRRRQPDKPEGRKPARGER